MRREPGEIGCQGRSATISNLGTRRFHFEGIGHSSSSKKVSKQRRVGKQILDGVSFVKMLSAEVMLPNSGDLKSGARSWLVRKPSVVFHWEATSRAIYCTHGLNRSFCRGSLSEIAGTDYPRAVRFRG